MPCNTTSSQMSVFINSNSQGRRENSRGPGQNFIRGPYDVIIFKQQD